MSKIVIVARTKMRNGVCCGALDLETFEFLRLHNERGGNLNADAPYQVGQIYDASYKTAWNLRPLPHSEDKQLMSAVYDHSISDTELIELIDKNVNVYRGGLSETFENCLQTSTFAPFVGKDKVPHNSVCFWRNDKPLTKVISFGKEKYVYDRNFISFVGFQNIVEHIPSGTLLRLSLANWWAKDESFEKKCFLQLSGWYGL